MTTNQEGVHAAVRAVTGTSRSYNEDWHALFDDEGIAAGPFNERMLAWINATLGTSYSNVNAAMQAFAVDQGFTNWASMNTFALGFSPEQLFSGGYLGDWFDATSISTLYQDSAKTTSVTADNDPVGAWVGRVNALTIQQATGVARPLYKSSNMTVLADGVDDNLMTAANVSFSGYPLSIAVLFDQSVNGASSGAVVSVAGGAADYMGLVLNTPGGSRAVDRNAASVVTSPLLSYPAASGLAAAFATYDANSQTFRFNNGSASTSATNNTHAAGRVIIGALRHSAGTPSLFSAFRIQQAIIINKVLTAQDQTNLLTYWGL